MFLKFLTQVRRLLPISLIVLIFSCRVSQPASAQSFQTRSTGVFTLQDYRAAAKYNFYIPRLTDTTLAGGKDTLGAIILVKSGSKQGVWYRDSVSTGGHKWSRVAGTSELVNYWQLSANNLTPISTSYNVGIGIATPLYRFDVFDGNSGHMAFQNGRLTLYDDVNRQNAKIGVGVGSSLSGSYNIGIANSSLAFTTGDFNIGIGAQSNYNTTGNRNVAMGVLSSVAPIGSDNVSIGTYANSGVMGNNNVAIGTSAITAATLLSDSLSHNVVGTGTQTFTGSEIATFITNSGISVGQSYIFRMDWRDSTVMPLPFTTGSNPTQIRKGVVTNSNTITFSQFVTFTSQGGDSLNLIVYSQQNNSIAIGYGVSTSNNNEIKIGNASSTLLTVGSNFKVDLTSVPSDQYALIYDAGAGSAIWQALGGGGGGVTSISANSPLSVVDGTSDAVISIANAEADGATKGAASFNSTDFNAVGGNISIDYASAPSASGVTKGFLSAADWTTFNNKASAATGAITTFYSSNATTSRAIVSDGSGKLAVSPTLASEIAFVSGVTSAIQTQLNSKLGTALTSARIFVGNGSNVATGVALSGDATITNAGVLTLANTTVVAGTYASANITVDAAGRITAAADGSGGGGGGSVTTVLGTSPIISDGDLVTPTISILNAAADGSTKGAATFSASDFNDNGIGLISIDYTNAQTATGAVKGFLSAADWTTFNNKVSSTISILAGTGLTGGGNLTVSRTLSLTNTGVSAGTYTNPASIVVDAQGRIVGISSGLAPVTSVFGRTGAVSAQSGDYTTTLVTEGSNLYYTNARVDSRIALQAGVAGGLATLDGSGKVPTSQLPAGAQVYKGTWNVSTNTPTLADGVGTSGDTYRVTVGGTRNLGSGNITWSVGDDAIYNGTIWQRNPAGGSGVASVNGFTGVVVLTTTDIAEGSNLYFNGKTTTDLPEGSNLYFTNARARLALSASTGISYNSGTGAISLANTSVTSGTYSYPTLTVDAQGRITTISTNTPVTSFNGRTGVVVPTSGDYTTTLVAEGTNLYFTNARADARITAARGVANGIASLDGSGKVPVAQLPAGAQVYKGTWSAATNTPTLADGVGSAGDTYRVTAAGTQNLGSGNITFSVGDDVIYNGTIWQRNPAAVSVTSVNGLTGTVVLTTDNIAQGSTNLYFSGKTTTNLPEGSNLYFTNARARSALSGGTGITYTAATGVIALANTTVVAGSYTATNITVDAQGRITSASNGSAGGGTVTSFAFTNGGGFTGVVTNPTSTPTLSLTAQDAAANGTTKGFSTYIAADFNAAAGVISLDYINGQAASAANKGFLTPTDWATFNAKQPAATGWVTPVMNTNLTANRAVISDATGKANVSTTTSGELAFLGGATSNIQAQLNTKETSIIYGFQTLTPGANITLNGNLGINFRVTLNGANSQLVLQNIVQGKVYKIEVNQDATGNRHLTLPATSLVGGSANGSGTSIILSTAASKKDLLTVVSDGTNLLWTIVRDFQ